LYYDRIVIVKAPMSRLTFAVKREKLQPSLFDFGVGKLNEGGRIPIPASVGTAQPVSQATSKPEKSKRGPGRPKKVGTTSGVAAKEALERQRAAAAPEKKKRKYAKYSFEEQPLHSCWLAELG